MSYDDYWTKDLVNENCFEDKAGVFQMILVGQLHVDGAYQREVLSSSMNKIKSIAKNWKWSSCGTLTVAKRPDGEFCIIDGQHRFLGAQLANSTYGANITHLPCLVFEMYDTSYEAKAFLDINSKRKGMSSHDKYKAAMMAGDVTAKIIDVALQNLGIKLVRGGSQPNYLSIGCIAKVIESAKKDYKSTLRVLSICAAVCKDSYIHDCLFQGLLWIDKNLENSQDSQKNFFERVLKFSPEKLVSAANRGAVFHNKGGQRSWGVGIVELLNKGVRKNKLVLKDQKID